MLEKFQFLGWREMIFLKFDQVSYDPNMNINVLIK